MSEYVDEMEARLQDSFGPHTPIYRPLVFHPQRFWLWLFILLATMGAAAATYLYQLREGLRVTSMNDGVSWGLYISSFVFFIGISHAGTLISAILRASQAEWRRPVTRIAEMITAFALMTGALLPLIDLGNIWNAPMMLLHPNIESPLIWDMVSITTYLFGSLIYLWLPMIPDLAVLRDRMVYPEGRHFLQDLWIKLQKRLYIILSMGWQGTPRQVKFLEQALFRMMVIIIPIAISVHTVIGYLFAMNATRPGWHTSIFGPLFVAGAIYSGIAAIILLMYVLNRLMGLDNYIKDLHFKYLGLLLLAIGMGMVYFTNSELLTFSYGNYTGVESELLSSKYNGQYAPMFWLLILGGFVIPIALIGHPRTRNTKGILISAVMVLIAMFVERVLIVIPSMAVPRLPYDWGYYVPTIYELVIIAGAFAWFMFLMTVFMKLFPIIGLWEMDEAGELEWAKETPAEELSGGTELLTDDKTPVENDEVPLAG